MAWLSSLLKKPEEEALEEPVLEEEVVEEPPPLPTGPQLAVLAPDVAGISSFRLRFYPDAAAAARNIEAMHPEMRRSTHAFWALHDEPVLPDEAHREALVLIRANHTSDVVYVVSFVDLESAWSFARFETKRGLDPSHLIILWAAFAQIREEFDGVSILPPEAPRTKNQPIETFQRPAVQRRASEAAREYAAPEPEAEEWAPIADSTETLAPPRKSATEADAERRAEAARREAEEAARMARQAQDELQAARRAADAARQEAAAEARLRAQLEARMEAARRAEEDERAALRAELEAETARLIAEEEPPAGMSVIAGEPSFTEAPPERATSYPGDDETWTGEDMAEDEPTARGTIFRHTAAAPKPRRPRRTKDITDPADDLPKEPDLDDFDIAYEVERLLQNRRWDTRDEPFSGFRSPPGRF
jgi:hypothetical protein